MNARYFDEPIFLRLGTKLIREIASLDDAIEFLDAWPPAQRNLFHEMAWRVCCEAFDGHKPLAVARDAFEGFAKRANILEAQPPSVTAVKNQVTSAERAKT